MGKLRTALLVALLFVGAAACSDEIIDPAGTVTAVVSGHAHAVDGGDLSGVWALWRPADGSAADSARLGADGSFRIEVTTAAISGELQIGGGDTPSYHPFLYPFDVADLAGVDVVIVPRVWTIRRGEFAGQVVATSLDPVVDDNTDQILYSYYFAQPHPRNAPERYLLDLQVWPEDNLPAKVAIDRLNYDDDLTAADSAAIWTVLERMEAVFGLDLFEPVVADPSWWPVPTGPFDAQRIPGVIRLTAQAPGWRAVQQPGEEPLTWEDDLGGWAAEGRFHAFRMNQQYLDAGGLVVGAFEPLRLADGFIPWETVFIHEMLHVLGVGHTCRVESPMGPCARTAEPSPFDVAYMELLREAMRLQRGLDTPLGMIPAIIGERRILLGRSALPNLDG